MRRLIPVLLALVPATALAAGGAAPKGDLATPRRALRTFIDAARAGDYRKAATALDLSQLPAAERARRGPHLAFELKLVLDQTLWIAWGKVPDTPAAGTPPGTVTIGEIAVDRAKVPIRLVRTARAPPVWKIDSDTVDAIPRLWDRYGVGWVAGWLPPVFFRARFLEVDAWQWLGLVLSGLAALVVGLLLGAAFRGIGLRIAGRTRVAWDDLLVAAAAGPVKALLGLGTFVAGVALLHLAVPAQGAVDHLTHTVLVGVLTWAGLRGVGLVAELLERRLVEKGGDGGHARGAKTQIVVLRRVADVILVILGGALLLLQFKGLRNLGTSLLASAGVAGIVIGLAAQRSIQMLLAGIQLSITQPIRLGDTVIVEGEWGTIEEITLTYVVLKVWDLRRLVIPIDRFLQTPFQNWTKMTPDLLGTVFLYADYTVPVDRVRDEVIRFVKGRAEWDGKASGLVVTNVSERTVELRALISAADSSKAWDLRCALREHLVSYLKELDGGRYLPRARVAAGDDAIARLEPATEG